MLGDSMLTSRPYQQIGAALSEGRRGGGEGGGIGQHDASVAPQHSINLVKDLAALVATAHVPRTLGDEAAGPTGWGLPYRPHEAAAAAASAAATIVAWQASLPRTPSRNGSHRGGLFAPYEITCVGRGDGNRASGQASLGRTSVGSSRVPGELAGDEHRDTASGMETRSGMEPPRRPGVEGNAEKRSSSWMTLGAELWEKDGMGTWEPLLKEARAIPTLPRGSRAAQDQAARMETISRPYTAEESSILRQLAGLTAENTDWDSLLANYGGMADAKNQRASTGAPAGTSRLYVPLSDAAHLLPYSREACGVPKAGHASASPQQVSASQLTLSTSNVRDPGAYQEASLAPAARSCANGAAQPELASSSAPSSMPVPGALSQGLAAAIDALSAREPISELSRGSDAPRLGQPPARTDECASVARNGVSARGTGVHELAAGMPELEVDTPGVDSQVSEKQRLKEPEAGKRGPLSPCQKQMSRTAVGFEPSAAAGLLDMATSWAGEDLELFPSVYWSTVPADRASSVAELATPTSEAAERVDAYACRGVHQQQGTRAMVGRRGRGVVVEDEWALALLTDLEANGRCLAGRSQRDEQLRSNTARQALQSGARRGELVPVKAACGTMPFATKFQDSASLRHTRIRRDSEVGPTGKTKWLRVDERARSTSPAREVFASQVRAGAYRNMEELFMPRQQQVVPRTIILESLDSRGRGLLRKRLFRLADAIETGNLVDVESLYAQLKPLATLNGIPLQRVLYYTLHALMLRLTGLGPTYLKMPQAKTLEEINAARMWYVNTCPNIPFCRVSITGEILSQIMGKSHVHIIDMGQGMIPQWPAIFAALAQQPGAPLKHLHLSWIDTTYLILGRNAGIDAEANGAMVAQGMQMAADAAGIPFSFEHVAVEQDSMHLLYEVRNRPKDTKVICTSLDLQFYNGDTEGSLKMQVLQWMRALDPARIVTTELYLDACSSALAVRCKSCFDFYVAMFEAHERRTDPEESHLYYTFEEVWFSRTISSMLACEGAERSFQPSAPDTLKRLFRNVGFNPQPLMPATLDATHELLRSFPQDFGLLLSDNVLSLSSRGTPMAFACSWG